MGYFVIGAVVLVVGLLLLNLLRSLKAQSLRLAGLAILLVGAMTGVLFFVLSGRFGFAAPLGALALWVMRAYLLARQIKATGAGDEGPQTASKGPMSRSEALDILGLQDGANADDIEEAYKALIMKNHPDQGGTDWLAARLNEARDTLLD